MFGFQIRTRPNVASPSPKTSPSPRTTGSPTVGEIDTRAPFQSVKAAVNLFGESSPKSGSRPALRRTRSKTDEKVLEKETLLHWTLKELDRYKENLKSAESTRAQARRDLEKANKTLLELTNKLEIISEDKHAAIESTEAAKYRAQQLELLKSSSTDEVNNDGWEEDVANERQRYRTSANELISTKQELTNLKQDFDAALEAKLAAFQQAADAQHAAKVNHQKMVELQKEVDQMRETLHRVKLASAKAHEEHLSLMEDKDAGIESTKKAKDDLDIKIESLRKEHNLSELRMLGQKLEETTEAISVLEEQLREVRVADMETLEKAKLEVEEARRRLEDLKEEQASLGAMVESLKQELDHVKRDVNLLRGDDLKREEQQAELDKMKQEIEETTFELTKAIDNIKELELKIKEMTLEADRAKKEEENAKEQAETLKTKAENAKTTNKEAEESLEVARRELEKAKAAQELANDQIQKRRAAGSTKTDDKIKLSTEEYEALKRKTEEADKAADAKVATAMAQVETIKKKEQTTLQKLEKSMEESKDIEAALSDALKMAEMAEAAKEAIESELRKWKKDGAAAKS